MEITLDDFLIGFFREYLFSGHGPSKWYYTYGKVEDALNEIKSWMIQNPEEIVVLYFGQILEPKQSAIETLRNLLEQDFDGKSGNPGLYRVNATKWPTLKEAKIENQRLFSFVRIENDSELKLLGMNVIGEVKVKVDKEIENIPGSQKVFSTYSSTKIGSECEKLPKKIEDACKRSEKADFNKLAIFSNAGKNIGTCLWTMARKCNSQLERTIDMCKSAGGIPVINFLQSDYPNYPGPNRKTNVQLAYEQNLANSK